MFLFNMLILYTINQKNAQGETDAYKKNIHVPVGHENRFTREEDLESILNIKRLNETTS